MKIEKKQLKLTHFCEQFDITKKTALEMIHSKGFPAYKLGGCWYVDIDAYYKWRELEHTRSYRWA